MELNKIDLSGEPENMKAVYLVLRIYDVHNQNADQEEKIFDHIIVSQKVLDMIDSINFTYVNDGLEPTEVIKKVGYLLNLHVYLDPHKETDNVTFTNDNKETYELEVIL
jgi:phosphopantetheine adenylyltransferase